MPKVPNPIRVSLAAALTLLCLAMCPAQAAEDGFKVIQTTDESHQLLPKTCEVCHKEAAPKFFLVTGSDAVSLQKALNLLSAGARNANQTLKGYEEKVQQNPHATTTCVFCHATQPVAGEEAAFMEFRTVAGMITGPANQEELCRLCHPSADMSEHTKVYSSKAKAAKDLELLGLPIYEGEILCTTCHDMHDAQAKPLALRPKVADFFKSSDVAMPHQRVLGCLSCHPTIQQRNTRAVFIDADPIKMCTRCHGKDHPVHQYGIKSTEKTYPMDFLAFPLGKDGELVCTTCHDEPCYSPLSEKNPRMLRGGPYYRKSALCDKCHPKAGKLAINPHKQISPKGEPIEAVCVLCHLVDPWEGEYGPGNMNYVETPSEICLDCHELNPHPSRDHLIWMEDKRADKMHAYEKRHEVLLPLGENNLISCYTCHNPHDKGVLSGLESLGAGEEKFLRIPSFAEICTPCHARYD